MDECAEAIATLEAAVAQQRQIYDLIGSGVLAAALLYDPGRGERQRHELRQYAQRTAYRMRDTSVQCCTVGDGGAGSGAAPGGRGTSASRPRRGRARQRPS
ncbi:hypothetical protein ACIP4Y_35940 [Streptomyces sp. NPDC088810]|uniref:hypothetical protein n=1 Tax=Streptomyces sp. NPDC088810 TaxID=3365904 RepID=UPI00383024C4